MRELKPDITQKLISEDILRNQLTSIFVDSIILKNNFKIAVLSKNIIDLLGFEMSELYGHSINFLGISDSLQGQLEKELSKGFFSELIISLKTKHGGTMSFNISGFYLGLISDLNGHVVLMVKEINAVVRLNNLLDQSRNELDEFIYRAAHDLRGPLATIRGLVNIMKLEEPGEGMKKLVEMLEHSAENLDDRLFKLIYLAESGQCDTDEGTVDCRILETSLRSTIEESMGIDGIHFHFSYTSTVIEGIHGQLVIAMLNNILLYLINLPKSEVNELLFATVELKEGIQFNIHSKGFKCNYQIRQAVTQSASLYADMLTYSHLINYYAAQKVARKLKATICINFVREEDQYITIFAPFTYPDTTPSYVDRPTR